ncbi:MAG: two-component sensor histidine kinase [Chitinophagaceae bacterium]|nr:two-component sensor histidine kinase [Chitinophagaceae bacterium]MCO5285727.1 histidine kinase [Chitinophagaceae bacterium]MCW5914163.1 two-component sensor histidine kinase [Chitinophagaceae bacterium]
MYSLQITQNFGNTMLIIGTIGMLFMGVMLVMALVFHQKRILLFNKMAQEFEKEKQELLLNSSIKFQEEERQRLAADLHDDAGPLLATARLYLNENLIHQDTAIQLQSIMSARQIIDDTIQLIRNISHSLLPPTLKNFGLDAALVDMFDKINNTGTIKASARFHNNTERLEDNQELLVFRIVQEIVGNILKHSNAGFIHLTQNAQGNWVYYRIHHDGKGIVQKEFDELSKKAAGLGLKNIQSRINVLHGRIFFEMDNTQSYYKITLEIPRQY